MTCTRGFLVACLLLGGSWAYPLLPAWAQLPWETEELSPGGDILRLAVVDVTVQGSYDPQAVREACNTLLPNLAACLATVPELRGRVPSKIILRFNLGSNGKVVWSKLLEPAEKKLEECFSKSLAAIRLPPAGSGLCRVTLVLACHADHLLSP